jgi:hypothetical protein
MTRLFVDAYDNGSRVFQCLNNGNPNTACRTGHQRFLT